LVGIFHDQWILLPGRLACRLDPTVRMETRMLARTVTLVSCLALLPVLSTASAQSYDATEIAFFHAVNRQPTELARYTYLTKKIPHLSPSQQLLANQLLAFTENELGLYDQAILGFPLKSSEPADLVLPTAADWQAENAVDVIAKLAASRRIVMVNEAHHDAHTRQLTLALLPRLRALGFTHFAAEALGDNDPGLMQRGYPIKTSGSEYLREPLYGEIIREAIRLGFIVVPYDSGADTTLAREIGQAENLYRRVFVKDPAARLFVHAGYAHIDKSKGRLGDVEPMAMQLEKLTGLVPLSIDQTQFMESIPNRSDAYHQLVDRFKPAQPSVLANRVSGDLWSADPKLYDVNVILPPSVNLQAFGRGGYFGGADNQKVRIINDASHLSMEFMAPNDMPRPDWLALDGKRYSVAITTSLCRASLPCQVEAIHSSESDDATAADRYAFMQSNSMSKLYLSPGTYRLRALSASGKVLSSQTIDVKER
jgi:hypothetical protein